MTLYEQFSEQEWQVLRARAERVAGAPQAEQEQDFITALSVTLRGETYAIPIHEITTVHDDIAIVHVPCVQIFVAGIANIRGHIVPVIDLAAFLGVPGDSDVQVSALIAAERGDLNVAFRIDGVGDVRQILKGKISPVPDTLNIQKMGCLYGTLPDGTVVLDMAAVMEDPLLTLKNASA